MYRCKTNSLWFTKKERVNSELSLKLMNWYFVTKTTVINRTEKH